MSDEKKSRLNIEDLPHTELRELTAEEAGRVKGGINGIGFGSSGKILTTKSNDESFVVTVAPPN